MLVLVRHGQSTANAGGLLVGRADPLLTPLGERQAGATGREVARAAHEAGRRLAAVVTSPLARARGTAEHIVQACEEAGVPCPAPRVDERAIELDYGSIDLLAVADLPRETWAAWRSDPGWRPPGGETLEEVSERFCELLAELSPAAADADVVVVSHVSPIKAGVAWALGVGVEVSWRLSLGVAAVTRVATGPAGPALVGFGEVRHLDGC